jgi:hypothetical protein
MDRKSDVDSDEVPADPETAPAADEMEQAQKDAAEERLQGGGYGG